MHRISKVFTNKELWRGEEKGEVMIENNRTYYECEYCGHSSTVATGGSCHRSPTGYHVYQ